MSERKTKLFLGPALGLAREPARGKISFANETAMDRNFLSEGLTEYAVGFQDSSGLEESLEALAPRVDVPELFEFHKDDNNQAFLGEIDDSDIRAWGAEFKVVSYDTDKVTASTISKGLTERFDVRQLNADKDYRDKVVRRLQRRLIRAEIYRAAAVLDVAAGKAVPLNWSGAGAKTDPDADLDLQILAATEDLGITPTSIAFGGGAWARRKLALRALATAGGFGTAFLGTKDLADYLNVPYLNIIREMRTATKTQKTTIVGTNSVYIYTAEPNQSKEDASNIKRFVSKEEGGGDWAVYEERSGKLISITVSHYSNIVATSTIGVRKLQIT